MRPAARVLAAATALLTVTSCARWFSTERNDPKKSTDALFLVNALEDTYARWPDAQSSDAQVYAWIAGTGRQLNRVRATIRTNNLDPDLGTLYDDALKFLESFEAFLAQLGVIDSQMKQRAGQDDTAAVLRGIQTAGNSKNNGVGAAVEGVFSGYLEGVARRTKRDAEKQAAVEAEQRRLRSNWQAISANAQAIAAKLSRKFEWKPGEASFDNYTAARDRDPFLKVRQATTRTDNETADAILLSARRCVEAYQAVPAGSDYDLFRTRFLASAADVAVTAATKDLKGYSQGPSRYAPEALDLVNRYLKSEPSDPGSYGRMLLARARGANHQLREAIEAANAARANWENDPGFCYRYARLMSLTDSPDLAADWLAAAYRTGWNQVKFARADPDMENLRNARADRWAELTTAKLTWKINWGVMNDDVVFQNVSPFVLTNVVAQVHIQQGSQVWDKELRCESIQPGATCKAENAFSIPGSRYDDAKVSFTSDQS